MKNLPEFAGILALDKWTGNANGRQAVFTRKQRERRYKAVFIDFGYCFHAGEWRFEDAPLRGVYYRNDVYRGITGWESFEPWLTRLETMPADTVWAAANDIPPEWYGGDMAELEALRSVSTSLRQVAREFSVYSLLSPVLVFGGLIQTAVGWGGCFGRACGKRSGLRA